VNTVAAPLAVGGISKTTGVAVTLFPRAGMVK
jgi:hypothetical protein